MKILNNMPTSKIILGFVGDLSSGKGTAAKYLKEKYNSNSYRFSTILRDIINRLYLPETRGNLQNISTVLRENFGQDVLSKVIAEDVKNDPNEIVVVEGVRRPTDITYLREIPGFHLIYITAESKLRWERLVKRGENEDDMEKTYEEFLKDEQAEADILIKELGKSAEYTIYNNLSFEEFYTEIEKILSEIKSKK